MRIIQTVGTFIAVLIGYIIWTVIGGVLGFFVGGFTATILAAGVNALLSKPSVDSGSEKSDEDKASGSEQDNE